MCREEALEEKEVRAAWTVEQSAIWRPRLREADSRGFWDTPGCRDRMFEADWARACNKEKFATMMARENKNSKVGTADQHIDSAVSLLSVQQLCSAHSCSSTHKLSGSTVHISWHMANAGTSGRQGGFERNS